MFACDHEVTSRPASFGKIEVSSQSVKGQTDQSWPFGRINAIRARAGTILTSSIGRNVSSLDIKKIRAKNFEVLKAKLIWSLTEAMRFVSPYPRRIAIRDIMFYGREME